MNSQQRRKLRRRWTCLNCRHNAYHCSAGGCNHYNGYGKGKPLWCSCTYFVPISSRHKPSLWVPPPPPIPKEPKSHIRGNTASLVIFDDLQDVP